MSDHERAERKLSAVHIGHGDNGDEYYRVGWGDVTSIEWDWTDGHMAALQTIVVFRNGKRHSEHCFSNVLGVYYADEDEQP